MTPELAAAIENAADYSETFTQDMQLFQDRLAQSLQVPVYLDSDMNYSASQNLTVFLDSSGIACTADSPDRAWQLVVFISSRGPFFTSRVRYRTGNNEWRPVEECARLPSGLEELRAQVVNSLSSKVIQYLNGPVLDTAAPKHVTEMDGVPATVFQVLFTELW